MKNTILLILLGLFLTTLVSGCADEGWGRHDNHRHHDEPVVQVNL